jgi:hypothetical protein
MSTDITGWIEVKRNNYWFGVVRINVLLQRNYPMFDFLFGGRSQDYAGALAGKRGIPEDRSIEVKDGWGDGDGIAGTWMSWSELKSVDWEKHTSILTNDWKRLFELMHLLSEWDNVEDVRLVVDFF